MIIISNVQRLLFGHSFLTDVNSSHLQGGVSVAKEVKYADKAQYLPWRPR